MTFTPLPLLPLPSFRPSSRSSILPLLYCPYCLLPSIHPFLFHSFHLPSSHLSPPLYRSLPSSIPPCKLSYLLTNHLLLFSISWSASSPSLIACVFICPTSPPPLPPSLQCFPLSSVVLSLFYCCDVSSVMEEKPLISLAFPHINTHLSSFSHPIALLKFILEFSLPWQAGC